MHACIYSICESSEIRLIMIICSGFRHFPLVSSIKIDLLYLQLESRWILDPIKYLPWKSVNFYGLCRSSLMLWSIVIDSLVPLQSWNGVKLTYLLRTRLMIESNLKCDDLTHWEQKWFTLCFEIRIEKRVKMYRKLVNIQRKFSYIQIDLWYHLEYFEYRWSSIENSSWNFLQQESGDHFRSVRIASFS